MLPRTSGSRGPPEGRRRSSGSGCAPTGRASGITLVVIGPGLLLHHLRQLPEPQVVPALRGRHEVRPRAAPARPGAVLRPRPGNRAAHLLGTGFTAHFLSTIYLWFLPLVPLALTAWLVWSRNISYGYWFATSQCIAWTLGTVSYYALPTLGPGFEYSWLYATCDHTATAELMDALCSGRDNVLVGGRRGRRAVGRRLRQPALRDHAAGRADGAVHDPRSEVLWVFWVNFGVTVVATLYFGWHYIADDVAGIADRADLLLRRWRRQRPEVRPPRPGLATRRRPPPRIVPVDEQRADIGTRSCSSSRRHAGEIEKIVENRFLVTRDALACSKCLGRWGSRSRPCTPTRRT